MDQAPEALFSRREVSEIIGLTFRQIQHWDQTELVTPSRRTAGGHGRYSFQDLIALRTAKRLLDAGVSLQRIRHSLRELQRLLPVVKRPLSELTLVATGDAILVFYEGTVFDAISGQAWIVEASEIKHSVDRWRKRVTELKKYKKARQGKRGSLEVEEAS
jgi:DNA-binding transcriptional MerR regulator